VRPPWRWFRPLYRARSPDGREWELYVVRTIGPPTPHYAPSRSLAFGPLDSYPPFLNPLAFLPALFAVGEALVRSVLLRFARGAGGTRYVEAVCWWPSEIRLTWETSGARVDGVVAALRQKLAQGVPPFVDGAELVRWNNELVDPERGDPFDAV